MNIQQRVEAILKADPKSRDSDRRLLLIYVQKAGLNLSPEQIEVFKSLPAFETIRRTRQSLQEQGKYPASPKIEAERYSKFEAMRGGGHTNPEETLEQTSTADFFSQNATPFPIKERPGYTNDGRRILYDE